MNTFTINGTTYNKLTSTEVIKVTTENFEKALANDKIVKVGPNFFRAAKVIEIQTDAIIKRNNGDKLFNA